MRAITEIPAKTPRPIGRTDSFCPGKPFAASALEEAEAELVDDVTALSGEPAAGWAWDGAGVGCALELVGADGEALLTGDEAEDVVVGTGCL